MTILTMRIQEHDQLLDLAANYIFKDAPAAAILERLHAARRHRHQAQNRQVLSAA